MPIMTNPTLNVDRPKMNPKSSGFLKNIIFGKKEWITNHPLVVLVTFSLLIRIGYILLQHSLWWDSYVYIGIGKFLASSGESGLFEVFRPPLHPLILGVFWRIGFEPLFIGPLLDVFFSLIIVILTYKIGILGFEQKTAFLAAAVSSATPVFLMHTGLILTEPLAMALTLGAVYLFISNRSSLLTGFLLGLAFLGKFPQGIVLPLLLLMIFFRHKRLLEKVKEMGLTGIGFGMIAAPYFFLNAKYLGDPFLPLTAGSWIVTTATWLYGTGALYYFTHFFLKYPLFLLFFGHVYLCLKNVALGIKQNKSQFISLFLTILCLGTIGYFLTVPRKEPRYLVVIIPYLALLSIAEARRIYTWLQLQEKPFVRPRAFVAVCFIVSIVFVPGSLSFEEPAYPSDLAEQFALFSTSAPILSSNPLPAAFSDARIIVLGNMEYAAATYEHEKRDAGLIVLTDCDLLCPPDDLACEERRKDVISTIITENELLYTKISKECTTRLLKISLEEVPR
ncbi:glycosyltransferase family 39 protein [Candidatus Woesearchaeota archaeon]|nr:glycosyltransferase family 39 protein [Candidatus Woesearchaeota archaeon]